MGIEGNTKSFSRSLGVGVTGIHERVTIKIDNTDYSFAFNDHIINMDFTFSSSTTDEFGVTHEQYTNVMIDKWNIAFAAATCRASALFKWDSSKTPSYSYGGK